MDISTKVVREVLEFSDNNILKNECISVLDSYLIEEPQLTELELKDSLKVYLKGLDWD